MIQLADLFSVPEMYLMSTVTDYFHRNHIDYHPEILFRDVKVTLQKTRPQQYGNWITGFIFHNRMLSGQAIQ